MTQPTLSERELECLEWVSFGKTSWETALILGVSERTINFHLINACRKLNVYGRQAAVALALRQNLLHSSPIKPTKAPAAKPLSAIAEPASA
ncbi:MAG: helix-turn-helix domain-containing protein [Alcaligenaceae bacterium]|jgi:LuxR family transcriptional regulator of spore coat protein